MNHCLNSLKITLGVVFRFGNSIVVSVDWYLLTLPVLSISGVTNAHLVNEKSIYITYYYRKSTYKFIK